MGGGQHTIVINISSDPFPILTNKLATSTV